MGCLDGKRWWSKTAHGMTSGSGTPRGLSPWVRGLQCPLRAIQHDQTSGKTCMLNVFWKQILKHTLSSWSKGLSKEFVEVQSLKLFAGTISKGTSISIHTNTVAKMIMFVKETNIGLCLMTWRGTWNGILYLPLLTETRHIVGAKQCYLQQCGGISGS